MYPRTSPHHCGGKTSAGLGFLREIALELSALFLQCAMTDVLTVPVERAGREKANGQQQRKADDETEKM